MVVERRSSLINSLAVAVDTYNVWRHGTTNRMVAATVKASLHRFMMSRTILSPSYGWGKRNSSFFCRDSPNGLFPLSAPTELRPASDPKPLSVIDQCDLVATAATPQAQLVWKIDNYTSDKVVTNAYNPDDSEGERTPRIITFDNIVSEQEIDTFRSIANTSWGELRPSTNTVEAALSRDFCEPECNELPLGAHHPCCSQFSVFDSATAADQPP